MVNLVRSRRPGGDYRWDIYVNGVLVEGGFWSREVAAACYLVWLAQQAPEKK